MINTDNKYFFPEITIYFRSKTGNESFELADQYFVLPTNEDFGIREKDQLSTEVVIGSPHWIFSLLTKANLDFRVPLGSVAQFFDRRLENKEYPTATILGGSTPSAMRYGSKIQPSNNDFDLILPVDPRDSTRAEQKIIREFIEILLIPHIKQVYRHLKKNYPDQVNDDVLTDILEKEIIDSFFSKTNVKTSVKTGQYKFYNLRLGPKLETIILPKSRLPFVLQSPFNATLYLIKRQLYLGRTCFGGTNAFEEAILTGEITTFPKDLIKSLNDYLFLHLMFLQTTGVKVPVDTLDEVFYNLLDNNPTKEILTSCFEHEFDKRYPITQGSVCDGTERRLTILCKTAFHIQRKSIRKHKNYHTLYETLFDQLKLLLENSEMKENKRFTYQLSKEISKNDRLNNLFVSLYLNAAFRYQDGDDPKEGYRRCANKSLKGITCRHRCHRSVIFIETNCENNPWSLNFSINKDILNLSKIAQDTAFKTFAEKEWSESEEQLLKNIEDSKIEKDKISIAMALLVLENPEISWESYQLPDSPLVTEYRDQLIDFLDELRKISKVIPAKLYLKASSKIISVLKALDTDQKIIDTHIRQYVSILASFLLQTPSAFASYPVIQGVSKEKLAYEMLVLLPTLYCSKQHAAIYLKDLPVLIKTETREHIEQTVKQLIYNVGNQDPSLLIKIATVLEIFETRDTFTSVKILSQAPSSKSKSQRRHIEAENALEAAISAIGIHKEIIKTIEPINIGGLLRLVTEHIPVKNPDHLRGIFKTLFKLAIHCGGYALAGWILKLLSETIGSSKTELANDLQTCHEILIEDVRMHPEIEVEQLQKILQILLELFPGDQKQEKSKVWVKEILKSDTYLPIIDDLMPLTNAEEWVINALNIKTLSRVPLDESLDIKEVEKLLRSQPKTALAESFELILSLQKQLISIKAKPELTFIQELISRFKAIDMKKILLSVLSAKKNIVFPDVSQARAHIYADFIAWLASYGEIPLDWVEELFSLMRPIFANEKDLGDAHRLALNGLIRLGLSKKLPSGFFEFFDTYGPHLEIRGADDLKGFVKQIARHPDLMHKLSIGSKEKLLYIIEGSLFENKMSLDDEFLKLAFDSLIEIIDFDKIYFESRREVDSIHNNYCKLIDIYSYIYQLKQKLENMEWVYTRLIDKQPSKERKYLCFTLSTLHCQALSTKQRSNKNIINETFAHRILKNLIKKGIELQKEYGTSIPTLINTLIFSIDQFPNIDAAFDDRVGLFKGLLQSMLKDPALRTPELCYRLKILFMMIVKNIKKVKSEEQALADFSTCVHLAAPICSTLSRIGYLGEIGMAFDQASDILELVHSLPGFTLCKKKIKGCDLAAKDYVKFLSSFLDSLIFTHIDLNKEGNYRKRAAAARSAEEAKALIQKKTERLPIQEPIRLSQESYITSLKCVEKLLDLSIKNISLLDSIYDGLFRLNLSELNWLKTKLQIHSLYRESEIPLHLFAKEETAKQFDHLYAQFVKKTLKLTNIISEVEKVTKKDFHEDINGNLLMSFKWLMIPLLNKKAFYSIFQHILLSKELLIEKYEIPLPNLATFIGQLLGILLDMPSKQYNSYFTALEIMGTYLFEHTFSVEDQWLFLEKMVEPLSWGNEGSVEVNTDYSLWSLVKSHLIFLCRCKQAFIANDSPLSQVITKHITDTSYRLHKTLKIFSSKNLKNTLPEKFRRGFDEILHNSLEKLIDKGKKVEAKQLFEDALCQGLLFNKELFKKLF